MDWPDAYLVALVGLRHLDGRLSHPGVHCRWVAERWSRVLSAAREIGPHRLLDGGGRDAEVLLGGG